uniref:Deltameth_res domain-containing protein n=1 Tax=Parastrongyloides trichosuri TaxID=131310 RepID=A0A0N4ZZ83_PARTI
MKVVQLIASARRAAPLVFRRNGHGHHAPVNPGPPVTMDSMTIPCKAYNTIHSELQSKFNTYLIGSFAFFALTFAYACYEDIFIYDALRTPKSYRERK